MSARDGVREKPAKWTARDGREFPTKGEAERHDALVEARDAYEATVRRWGKALAATHLTKDGEPFRIGRWGSYWQLFKPFDARPYVRRIENLWGYPTFEWDGRGELEISEPHSITRKGEIPRKIRISDLYANVRNAQRDLIDATEKWLAEEQKHLDELRFKAGGS